MVFCGFNNNYADATIIDASQIREALQEGLPSAKELIIKKYNVQDIENGGEKIPTIVLGGHNKEVKEEIEQLKKLYQEVMIGYWKIQNNKQSYLAQEAFKGIFLAGIGFLIEGGCLPAFGGFVGEPGSIQFWANFGLAGGLRIIEFFCFVQACNITQDVYKKAFSKEFKRNVQENEKFIKSLMVKPATDKV
jgi:hypothetical protein